MQYYSTKHQSAPVTFREAIMRSEAPDGGLYMPASLPVLPKAFFKNLVAMTAGEIAYVVSNMLLGQEFSSSQLKYIVDTAVNFDIPLTRIDDNVYMLELYHGPTGTVKDIGSRYLALMLNHVNSVAVRNINVLLATSGNTGNAVSNGMLNIPGINVVSICPSDRPDQRMLKKHVKGSNVHLLGVNGTIEDCRTLMDRAMNDPELTSGHLLTSANSTNIGRTLAHTFLYFLGIARLREMRRDESEVSFALPAGNCGTLLAGCISKRMGLSVKRLYAGCNSSGSIHNFLHPEEQTTSSENESLTYAVNVNTPSNLTRFVDLYGSREAMLRDIDSGKYDDEAVQRTIEEVKQRTGIDMEPHTALAYRCMKDKMSSNEIGIVLATADPQLHANEHTHAHNRLDIRRESVPPTYPAFRRQLLTLLK